ncbi:MAG: energy transducer TonB, partial [Bacteroidia bacterium]
KIVLAENKTKQKNERDNNPDVVEEERSYGAKKQDATLSDAQSSLNDADTKSIGSIDKETFQQQASKDVNTVISAQAGVIANDENRAEGSVKSKKIVGASSSQPSMAYNDQQSNTEQSPAAPVEAKKAEEKARSSTYYANAALKSDASKNYKEPAFINGDSAFAAYAKQNLKISSTINSGIIVVEFLVDKNGKAANIEILKSLNNCDACSKDVIDFIKSIKKWQPAIQNGNAISAPKKISIQYN